MPHVLQCVQVSPVTHADSAAEYLVAIGVYSTLPWPVLRPELRTVHPPMQAPQVDAPASHQAASAPASQQPAAHQPAASQTCEQPAAIPTCEHPAAISTFQQPAPLPAAQHAAAVEQPCFKFVRPVTTDGQATQRGQPQVILILGAMQHVQGIAGQEVLIESCKP